VGSGATACDGNKLGNSRIGEAGSRFPRFVRVAAGTCGGGSRRRMACLEWGDLRREETDCGNGKWGSRVKSRMLVRWFLCCVVVIV
jgi:hypothetical protein